MKSISLVTLAASLFSSQALASCGHGTSLLKRQVHEKRDLNGLTSREVKVATFGYLGANGPANWQNLAPENAVCANGTQQSPIDLNESASTSVAGSELNITIPKVDHAEFENLGSTIEVVMSGLGGSTTIKGKKFDLAQFHFHSPSEHTVNGEHFPLEMHMVHQAADGAIAVLGVHFSLSSKSNSPLLNAIAPTLANITKPGSIAETGPLDFTTLIKTFKSKPVHTYKGSLTTPPCTEGPQFYISSAVFDIDVKTYNAIKSVVGFNSRFIQNAGGEENILEMARGA